MAVKSHAEHGDECECDENLRSLSMVPFRSVGTGVSALQQSAIFFTRSYLRRKRHESLTNGPDALGEGYSMSAILILVALSALSGFAGGRYFSWPSPVMTGAVLAPLAAVVLQRQDFTALPGISVIVACLVINQAAYVVAIWLKNRNYLPQQSDDVPHSGRKDRIDRKHKRDQNAQR
jgi:hypothetical protein